MVGKKKECFGVQRAAYSKSVMRRSYRRWCMYLKISVTGSSLAAYRDACKSENNPDLSKKKSGFPKGHSGPTNKNWVFHLLKSDIGVEPRVYRSFTNS